jgi:hypothetical protein
MHDVSETGTEVARERTFARGPRLLRRSLKAASVAAVVCGLTTLSAGVAAKGTQPAPPRRVSLIQLVASPEEFDGKLVQVAGYCFLGFEERGLYLNQEDWSYGVNKNAIWLDLKGHSELSGQYVLMEGIFSANDQTDDYSGSLKKITQFAVQKKRKAPK